MDNTHSTKPEKQPLGLKILLWFTVFMIVGGAVCIILGALQWAIHTAIIVGAILIVIGLIFVVSYQSLRRKIHQGRLDHEAAEQARIENKSENDE